jgi:hypothetical protein
MQFKKSEANLYHGTSAVHKAKTHQKISLRGG